MSTCTEGSPKQGYVEGANPRNAALLTSRGLSQVKPFFKKSKNINLFLKQSQLRKSGRLGGEGLFSS